VAYRKSLRSDLSIMTMSDIFSNDKIATIAIKHKTFELDKPGWVAALVDAHKRKEKYIMVRNI